MTLQSGPSLQRGPHLRASLPQNPSEGLIQQQWRLDMVAPAGLPLQAHPAGPTLLTARATMQNTPNTESSGVLEALGAAVQTPQPRSLFPQDGGGTATRVSP